MDPVLRYTAQRLPEMIEWIGQLVRIESPTHEKAAVDRAVEFTDSLDFRRQIRFEH